MSELLDTLNNLVATYNKLGETWDQPPVSDHILLAALATLQITLTDDPTHQSAIEYLAACHRQLKVAPDGPAKRTAAESIEKMTSALLKALALQLPDQPPESLT